MIKKSHKLLERFINCRIIYNMLDEEALTEYLNQDDPVTIYALKVFRDNAAFPKKPKTTTEKKGMGKTVLAHPRSIYDNRGIHISGCHTAHV